MDLVSRNSATDGINKVVPKVYLLIFIQDSRYKRWKFKIRFIRNYSRITKKKKYWLIMGERFIKIMQLIFWIIKLLAVLKSFIRVKIILF